jgi:hypothetical protein
MITNKQAGPRRIESRRPVDLQSCSGQPHNVPEKDSLRQIVLARVDEDS